MPLALLVLTFPRGTVLPRNERNLAERKGVAVSLRERLSRAVNLRAGEGRTLAVMGGFLLLNTANTTVLSAAKNGLFLSVYPGARIPHAVIGASLITALVAIVFTGYLAGAARRKLAVGLTGVLGASVLACRILFAIEPSTSFAIYLWLSAVQVLMLTHAWDYAGDLLTGRQAKRLIPLIGVGASFGAIVGGAGVAPAAFWLGTDDLLWISVGLLLLALPLLWAIPEPARESEEGGVQKGGATKAFVMRASRGVRSVGTNKLLRLLALGLIALTLTGTLIDLQLKFLLQETYPRDRITAIYGLLSATSVSVRLSSSCGPRRSSSQGTACRSRPCCTEACLRSRQPAPQSWGGCTCWWRPRLSTTCSSSVSRSR